MQRRSIAGFIFVVLLLVTSCSERRASVVSSPSPDANSPVVDDFSARVKKYADLRDALAKDLPPLKEKSDAATLNERRKTLAAAVQKARAGSQRGEIFTPAIQSYFSKVLSSEMKGAAGADARDVVKDGNPKFEPGATPPVKPNAPYPEAEPLSSVPATILVRLPALPEEMDYRFVGRDLVLRDAKTGLVVDIFPSATPPLGGKS